MEELPGAAQAGAKLKQTSMRDFAPPVEGKAGQPYKLMVDPSDAPVPALWRYALTLTGLRANGPDEKVAWWVSFSYKGDNCELAHEKFGVRLYLRTDLPESEAASRQMDIVKKLRSSVRTVEQMILSVAPELLGEGAATVLNQHVRLLRAYEYFRERAENPTPVDDVHEEGETEGGAPWRTFTSGKIQMQLNSFHDMIAAIAAYLSLLEHILVLALPFTDFDPGRDNLTDIIGSKWGDKWRRVLGVGVEAARFREKLAEVVERWRNPYSHGGFEKGHGATIWLHTPKIGAIPVGMSNVRDSPHFSFLPAGETDVAETFALFDELDYWLRQQLPEAVLWWESGLDVRFDAEFREQVARAKKRGEFEELLAHQAQRQMIIDNMDF